MEYKVYAQTEGSCLVHYVDIVTKEEVASALVRFISSRDDGNVDDEIRIVDAFGRGRAVGMELLDVPLAKGENLLKLKFNDGLKHTLDINVVRTVEGEPCG